MINERKNQCRSKRGGNPQTKQFVVYVTILSNLLNTRISVSTEVPTRSRRKRNPETRIFLINERIYETTVTEFKNLFQKTCFRDIKIKHDQVFNSSVMN